MDRLGDEDDNGDDEDVNTTDDADEVEGDDDDAKTDDDAACDDDAEVCRLFEAFFSKAEEAEEAAARGEGAEPSSLPSSSLTV